MNNNTETSNSPVTKPIYRLAIFDMDGTILYTLDDLTRAANYALEHNGFPERSFDEIRRFVGNGRLKLLERALPDGVFPTLNESVKNSLYRDLSEYYRDHCCDNASAYDGVPEMLRLLRALGVRTAVSSNKADSEVRRLADVFFPGLLDYTIGDREGFRHKPYPDSALEIMRITGIPAEQTVYIGDSDVDIETAKNAGIDMISVCWGFRGVDFLIEKGAKKLAYTPGDVLRMIMGR